MAYYNAYYYLFVDPSGLITLIARSPAFRRLEQNKIASYVLFIPWLTKKITEMEERKAQVRDRQYRLIELNNRAMHDLGKNKNFTKEERKYCREFISEECDRRRAASGHSPYQPTGKEKMDLEFITKQFDAIDGRDIVPLRLDDTFLTYNPHPPEVVLPPLESAPLLEQLWMIFSVTLKCIGGMIGVATLILLLMFLYAGFLEAYYPGELDKLVYKKPKIQPPQPKKGEMSTPDKNK